MIFNYLVERLGSGGGKPGDPILAMLGVYLHAVYII